MRGIELGCCPICLRNVCKGAALMPMLAIYCDDSGTHPDSRSAAVAGYISNVAQWVLFTKEWKRVLYQFGIDQMHRADLEALRGGFAPKYGWDSNRRKDLLERLHSIIRRRTKVAVGTSVIKQDFEEVMPDHLKEMYGGVYGWCAHCCLVYARVWCEKPQRQYGDPIEFTFEAGTTGQGQVQKMFDNLRKSPIYRKDFRIGNVSFHGKTVIPLQAADVIAYEVFKQTENQVIDGGSKHDIRRSLSALLREADFGYLDYWDRERLIDWIKHREELKQESKAPLHASGNYQTFQI